RMFGAFLMGLHVPRIHAVLPKAGLLSGLTPCIPNSTRNPIAFPRSIDPYFCLADAVLLLEAVLRSVGIGSWAANINTEGVEVGTGESRGCICLCGNALPRSEPRGASCAFLKLKIQGPSIKGHLLSIALQFQLESVREQSLNQNSQ